MNCHIEWVVTNGEVLKGSKHTIIITRETFDDQEIVLVNHIIVIDMDDEDPPIEEETTLPSLKKGV